MGEFAYPHCIVSFIYGLTASAGKSKTVQSPFRAAAPFSNVNPRYVRPDLRSCSGRALCFSFGIDGSYAASCHPRRSLRMPRTKPPPILRQKSCSFLKTYAILLSQRTRKATNRRKRGNNKHKCAGLLSFFCHCCSPPNGSPCEYGPPLRTSLRPFRKQPQEAGGASLKVGRNYKNIRSDVGR